MKKIFAAMVILGLGVMVGCGEDAKPGAKSTASSASTTTTMTHTTAASTGSK